MKHALRMMEAQVALRCCMLYNDLYQAGGEQREFLMDCVNTQQLIKPYLDGYLSDRELEEFLDHVQTCPDCFDELEVYFSIYRTLRDVDEKGDYNFRKKLRRKLEESRSYLRRRNQSKALRAGIILTAEFALAAALWGVMTLPGRSGEEPAAVGQQAVYETAGSQEQYGEEVFSQETQISEEETIG